MQIKTTSGSGAGALGIIGTGLALALPDAKWIGWTLVAIGLLVFVFDVHIERGQIAAIGSTATFRQRFKHMWPQYLMMVCGVGFFIGLVGFLQMNVSLPTPTSNGAETNSLPNLRRLFDTDFDNTFRHARDVTITGTNPLTKEQAYNVVIRRTTYQDYQSQSLFGGFYIPKSDFTFEVGMYLARQGRQMLQESLNEIKVEMKIPGDSSKTSLSDLTFTGRVYLYHESDLTLRQSADIDEAFSQNGMKIQLRGFEYAIARWNDEKQRASAKKN